MINPPSFTASVCKYLSYQLSYFSLRISVIRKNQPEEVYPKSKSDFPDSSPGVITLDDETQAPHTLFGGFYTTRNGLKSKLLINNKAPQAIEVAPTLYGESGATLQIAPIIVERNSVMVINLGDWANIGGDDFRHG